MYKKTHVEHANNGTVAIKERSFNQIPARTVYCTSPSMLHTIVRFVPSWATLHGSVRTWNTAAPYDAVRQLLPPHRRATRGGTRSFAPHAPASAAHGSARHPFTWLRARSRAITTSRPVAIHAATNPSRSGLVYKKTYNPCVACAFCTRPSCECHRCRYAGGQACQYPRTLTYNRTQ